MIGTTEEVPLSRALELKRGYDLPARLRVAGRFPVVSSSGVIGYHNERKVKAPGVVTGRYGTIGEVHFVEDDFWPLNTTLYVADFKGNEPEFISYLLQRIDWASFSRKSAVPGINRNHLRNVRVWVPPCEEQKQISRILRTWCKAISGLECVMDKARLRKGALAQELMTGRKRFKGFDGQRWQKHRLGELLQELGRYVTFDDDHTYKLASVRRRSDGLFFREALQGKDIKTKVMKTIHAGDFLLSKMQVVHGAWGVGDTRVRRHVRFGLLRGVGALGFKET
jgi:hypothetical protein